MSLNKLKPPSDCRALSNSFTISEYTKAMVSVSEFVTDDDVVVDTVIIGVDKLDNIFGLDTPVRFSVCT